MSQRPPNPPEGMPRISPMLFYRDVAGALEWLERAFGFGERMRLPGPDGAIAHAEMQVGEAVIMLGPESAERETASASALPAVNQSLYVYVDDLDGHCRQARAAGAAVTSEPEEMFWGDRIYNVRDLEGHHWCFAQAVKVVAPEDMTPPGS